MLSRRQFSVISDWSKFTQRSSTRRARLPGKHSPFCVELLEDRLALTAVPVGTEFQVNSYTMGDQRYTSIAMDASGNFIVAWSSNGQDGSGYGVYAQRYNASGVALGPEFRVNSYTTSY